MVSRVENIELVRRAMQAVYQAPDLPGAFESLYRQISKWELSADHSEDDEARRILDGLLSLVSFLENRKLQHSAEELLLYVITNFPEQYFPQLPRANVVSSLDLSLFQEARELLKTKPFPEKVHISLDAFEDQFRRANLNLPLLAAEIASGSFYREGPGRAGELFRSFEELATILQDTPAKDIPWGLMNQLAIKLNNIISGFDQSFLFMKALDTVRTSRPAGWLRDEMVRNQQFFQRNHCWRNLDEAILAKDYPGILLWVDKALTSVGDPYERIYLTQLRESAARKIHVRSDKWIAVAAVLVILVVLIFVLSGERGVRKRINLDNARKEILQALKTGWIDEEESPEVSSNIPIPVKSRTNLLENRPPLKPHSRKLNLSEIRHAIFQRVRLDYLKAQTLSAGERQQVEILENDWRSRCEFYEYENEDREKVHWDLKIHHQTLILDAQDILKAMRQGSDVTIDTIGSGVVLDFNNAVHLQIVVKRLKDLGFLKVTELPKMWNEDCRRALMEFKATHLSVVDAVWDKKTQQAMFPGN